MIKIEILSILLLLIGNTSAENDIVREDFIHTISNNTINESIDELGTNATMGI